ncbi:integrase core domain protein [Gregarina niphandrodes]|uniref:Integrase core domain protein n=1 Tax=Gregarina niphandrodes TaxID=110365 RepID=A0A023AXV7_GRENI|nr:integrase core domain protein [Gregarina niphandrodes]EZG43491.1 integrase core domain protein [Gregarina niphandrodes]|eukprot:XP_011133273.1 integrase core domain protein [Gregarina niphandrodes]
MEVIEYGSKKLTQAQGDNNYVADTLSRLQDDEDHDRDRDATHIGNRPFAVHFAEVSQNLFQLPSRNEFLVKDDDVPVDELQNLLKREDGLRANTHSKGRNTTSLCAYILVCIDRATLYIVARATLVKTAAVTRNLFAESVVGALGIPFEVYTDGGTEFRGDFHDYVTSVLKVKHINAAPYLLRQNGLNESNHFELGDAVGTMVEPVEPVVVDCPDAMAD